MAAIAVGESGIDALFFDRIGTHALPLMYLLQAGATFVAMLGLTGTSATAGVLGASPTRPDWSAIRGYLNANCGTSFAP